MIQECANTNATRAGGKACLKKVKITAKRIVSKYNTFDTNRFEQDLSRVKQDFMSEDDRRIERYNLYEPVDTPQ